MEKVCTKCKCQKSLDLFSARKKSKDGHASWCRECFKASWEKRYYDNHKHYRDSHNRSRNKIRLQNSRRVFEYLSCNPCITCGESDPIVLEFDHRNKDEKLENISNLILNSSWNQIESEIEKCDVMCANCHRRKTAAQFEYRRYGFISL